MRGRNPACTEVLQPYFFAHRAIHDVKATDMGLSKVRFKAEVDFDGRVVTRSYLEKQDIDQILNVSLLFLFSVDNFVDIKKIMLFHTQLLMVLFSVSR